MGKYSQAHQPMAVHTPLGTDELLLERFHGLEALSALFQFDLDLLAEAGTNIRFDQLLGQRCTVSLKLAGGGSRYFDGIVAQFSEGRRWRSPDGDEFVCYRARVVPKLWLLTRRIQCRIFQQLSVPDILKQVLYGLDVSYQIQGAFEPRDYCVQYRESDFAFANRLMEEEGIYYFFTHSADGHQLVLANSPGSHPDVPAAAQVVFDDASGGARAEDRVFAWEKKQELRSTQVTLWDHCFELPGQNLEATQVIQDHATVGSVQHPLQVAGSSGLQIFDYPGAYAGRVDGIDPGGGERSAELRKIFNDNVRTAGIRMQEEAARAIVVSGESYCRQFIAGHRFTLDHHPRGKGAYVLTRVEHLASLPGYASGGSAELEYQNRFTAIPPDLPFRPARTTPRPMIPGTQTATVVGPAGEEIFCDKYGRIKVQFHWDRQGKKNAESSCWVRVSQSWAGKLFGGIYLPRVGQEVVVAFEDGDPDQPIVTGSVYNSEQMPPYPLPDQRMRSGFRSRSLGSGKGPGNCHELRFDDTGDEEGLHLHSENYMHHEAEVKQTHFVGWGARGGSGSGSGPADTNGSGHGAGEEDKGFWKSVKGINSEGVWGQNFEFVFGGSNEIVIGENAELVAGVNFEVYLGFYFEAVFGISWEVVVGGQFETAYGPSIGIRSGNVYEKTTGNVLEIINGDAIEIVNQGNLAFIVNGWVIEMRKAAEMPKANADTVNYLVKEMEALGNPAQIVAVGLGPVPKLASGQWTNWFNNNYLVGQVAKMAESNPIPNVEAFKEMFLVTYGNLDLVSKGTDPDGGNISLKAIGAGKKITIAAETIELIGQNVIVKAATNWNATTNAIFQADYDATKLESQMQIAELELDFLKETAEALKLEAESSIQYVTHGTYWIALMVIILIATVALLGAAVITSETTEP